jgi:phage repressor protein C with HTH and peptisase S24 domain
MASTNDMMDNLKIWLKETLLWLHDDESPELLQSPYKKLIEIMMREAEDDNHRRHVWDRIEEMEKLIPHMVDTREQGEAYVHCAKIAADLENIKVAQRLFQAAENKYKSYPHQHAVTFWMIGCIYWLTYEKVEAISSWQDAISLFKERQLSARVDPIKFKWYVEKIPELDQYLVQAIANETLPPYQHTRQQASDQATTASTSAQNPAPESDPNPDPNPAPEAEERDSIRWLSCFIRDSVPAGEFGPAGFDPIPAGYLEFSEVMIEDEAYEIHSIKRKSMQRNIVNIDSSTEYQTVRVKGTSMNVARPVPIHDGDYILLRQQNSPGDNEIVVAEIIGYDTLATVKRLNYRNGKIQLIPESTDQQHYDNPDWGKEWNWNEIRFVGVVEAVFKKKPQ